MKRESNEKQVVFPQLRFRRFREADGWENKPLKSLAVRSTRKNTEGKYTRVLTNSAEYGVIDQRDYFEKDIATQGKLEGYYIVEKGDYVYNPRISVRAPVGPISKNNVGVGVMSPLYTVFRFENCDNDFYAHYFNSTHWHQYMRRAASTGARHDRMSISGDDFLGLPLPVTAPEEEQLISDCLTSVDNLIVEEARRLDVLKMHKSCVIKVLFPGNGETTPGMRFPEFHGFGDWEPTTLGSITDFKSGGTPSKDNAAFWNGSIPWASAKDMKHLFLQDTEDHVTPTAIAEGAKLAPAGSILILIRGMTLLKDVPICVLTSEMSFNQDVKALLPKVDVDGRFLAYFLLGCKQRLLSLVDIAGHGTGRLDTDKLKSLEVMLPKLAEQQRIAECLISLEQLIVEQGNKVRTLKNYKTGLAHRLFPLSDEVVA